MRNFKWLLLLTIVGLQAFAGWSSEEVGSTKDVENVVLKTRQLKRVKKVKSSKKKKSKKSTNKPSPPTERPTSSPTLRPTAKKPKSSKKKSDKKTSPPTPSPVVVTESPSQSPSESPSQSPTATPAILITLPVCSNDCENIGIKMVNDADVVAQFKAAATAGTNIEPDSVSVELESQSPCRSCGVALGEFQVRKLQGSGESDVKLKLTVTDPTVSEELSVEKTVAAVQESSEEIASTLETKLDATADFEEIVVEENNPTPSPVMPPGGSPPPAARGVKHRLFAAETKNVVEARRALEYDDDFKTLKRLNVESQIQHGYDFLSEFLHDGEPLPPTDQTKASRAIVAYSAPTSMNMSQGKNEMYHTNFKYFLDNAVDCSKHATLIVTTDEVAEVYRARIEKMNEDLCSESQHSVAVTTRVDKCYDMESMATFVRQTDPTKYDYFLYVNCGMVGPKTAGDEHWTEIFTSKLSDKVKMVGVSINLSFYPHVQSMVFATDRVGLEEIKNSGAIYDCGIMNNEKMTEEERWKLIMRYEIGMSRVIIEAGYTITSLTGALGNPIFIDQGDIEGIKNKSHAYMMTKEVNEIDHSIWNSEELKHLLPFGDDIWNADTIRSMADGKLPTWSYFVFYKASRMLLLPDIIEEVQYNLEYEVIEEYHIHSIPNLVDPSRDICEEAKTNFREASKLGVLVTGLQHSGTTMLSQLIKSAPGFFGGFECGLLTQLFVRPVYHDWVFHDWLEWSVESDLWSLNDESRDLVENAKCVAEQYYYLHQYSPLYHFGNHQNDLIVDKTPSYIHHLEKIMDLTPGVPVVVSVKAKSHLIKSWKKRGVPDVKIERNIEGAFQQIEIAMKKYPDRLKLVNTTEWAEKPDEILGDLFDFLGKEWKHEYLNMFALNSKRVPGSVVSKPFLTKNEAME